MKRYAELDSQSTAFLSQMQAGLQLLISARRYAGDLDEDVWDFAVEIESLRSAGMTNGDLRWLVSKGFVRHGRDLTLPGDKPRKFRQDEGLVFGDQTCFVLTDPAFEAFDASDVGSATDLPRPAADVHVQTIQSVGSNRMGGIPRWDPDRRQLQFGEFLIKEFKLNSPNQETIIMAFEEEGWPPRIDDPLLPRGDIDPKERLRNTIKSLNRCQINSLIRFMGDGTGQAIRWEAISFAPQGRAARRKP